LSVLLTLGLGSYRTVNTAQTGYTKPICQHCKGQIRHLS